LELVEDIPLQNSSSNNQHHTKKNFGTHDCKPPICTEKRHAKNVSRAEFSCWYANKSVCTDLAYRIGFISLKHYLIGVNYRYI